MKDNEKAVSDSVKCLAAFWGVDGALVITDKFRLIGFGSEITAASPSLKSVEIAFDYIGEKTKEESIPNLWH